MAWTSNYLSIWILESDTRIYSSKFYEFYCNFLSSFWSRILGKSCVWSMIKHGLSFLCILCIYCLHMTIFMNKFCIYKQMLGEYYHCKSTYIRVTLLKIDTYIHWFVALICLFWRKSKQNIWVYGPIIWWRHQMENFPHNSPFVRGIHRSHTKASDTELWCFLLICVWINSWVKNREAGDLRRHRGHYDANVMKMPLKNSTQSSDHKGVLY